ncbi:MAG: DUF2946 domain-containing protein [Burkholderiaceae bacterium]|nr:DUF2946 domain-containing protein [Burkholderiaceae bacterium]
MRSRFTTHLHVRWMTIFVVWFACLAPTVSHAMRDLGLPTLGAICTSNAFLSAKLNGANTPTWEPADKSVPGPVADGLAHCPFCFLQGHDSALPSQPLALSMPGGLRVELPRLFLQATHTLHAWTSAQPRAPPKSG